MNRSFAFSLALLVLVPAAARALTVQELTLPDSARIGDSPGLAISVSLDCASTQELTPSIETQLTPAGQEFTVTIDNAVNPDINCLINLPAELVVPLGPIEVPDIDVEVRVIAREVVGLDLVPTPPIPVASRQFEITNLRPSAVLPGNPTVLDTAWLRVYGCSPQVTYVATAVNIDASCAAKGTPAVNVVVLEAQTGIQQLRVSYGEAIGSDALRRHTEYREFSFANTVPGAVTGHWHDPKNTGWGFKFQLLGPERLLVHWLAYDADGNRMWLIAVLDQVAIDALVGPAPFRTTFLGQAFLTSGAGFPPDFDPDSVITTDAGELEVVFSACDAARATWNLEASSGLPSGSADIVQLSSTSGLNCSQRRPPVRS